MYVLLAFVLHLTMILNPYQIIKAQNPVKQEHDTSKREKSRETLPITAGSTKPNKTNTENKGNDDNEPSKDRTYKVEVKKVPFDYLMLLYVICNGLIAVFTLGTLLTIWSQRNVMKDQVAAMRDQLTEMSTAREQTIKQMEIASIQTGDVARQGAAQVAALNYASGVALETARAAKISAEAADLTAKTLVKIESSRIVPVLDWVPGQGAIQDMTHHEGEEIIRRTGVYVRVIARNEGRITGWITEERLGIGIFDHIPNNPDFENINILYHGLQDVGSNGGTFQQDESRIIEGEQGAGAMIVIWGIVKYWDVFNASKISTFGYVVSLNREFVRLQLPIYNQST